MANQLESIGFYTLSDARAASASHETALSRCEVLLTAKCNFRCPYCRSMGEELSFEQAKNIVDIWAKDGLKNIRFSGGEPTVWKNLPELISYTKNKIQRIAISTNGSASLDLYKKLVDCGVNDFSISFDACCAEDGDKMAGGIKGAWKKVVANIREISKMAYTTVGVVLTEANEKALLNTIQVAHDLGVSDIRVIPAAQHGAKLANLDISSEILSKYPILNYRYKNAQAGNAVRGINARDSGYCGLVLDDMAIMGDKHYPCIIYLRENGSPIGNVGPNMREERRVWTMKNNTHCNPICKKNCLDVCVDYNNTFRRLNPNCPK